ncbi:MAG: glutathione S-transferase [Halioglobus sp.]
MSGFIGRSDGFWAYSIELDEGRFLSESNAIIDYLAFGTTLLPEDKFVRGKILQ